MSRVVIVSVETGYFVDKNEFKIDKIGIIIKTLNFVQHLIDTDLVLINHDVLLFN